MTTDHDRDLGPVNPPGRIDWRGIRETWLGSAIFSMTLVVFLMILIPQPRNSDNSMKAEFLTPAFAAGLTISIWVLHRVSSRPVRYAAWWWVVLSGFGVALGLLVLLAKTVGT